MALNEKIIGFIGLCFKAMNKYFFRSFEVYLEAKIIVLIGFDFSTTSYICSKTV